MSTRINWAKMHRSSAHAAPNLCIFLHALNGKFPSQVGVCQFGRELSPKEHPAHSQTLRTTAGAPAMDYVEGENH